MYYPLNYDQITWMRGHFAPASVKTVNSASFDYWTRSLYQRMISVIDFELPDDWNGGVRDFFYWCLFALGYVMIAKEEKFGTFFQPVTLGGYDFYYQFVWAQLSNPKLSKTYIIHEDCEILKLTPDYKTTFDVVYRYAEQLATLDVAINTNIINSKLAYILAGKNKATAEALKTIMDRVNKGEPAVFVDKAIDDTTPKDGISPFQFQAIANLKDNYILDQLLREHQTIINSFDSEIGIITVPYQKAERMVTSEANSKTQDATSRLETWCGTLDSSIEEVKKLFPDIKLSYTVRSDKYEESVGSDNGGSKDNIDRNE